MSYAPVELRHVPLKRGLFGYKRSGVDAVLDDIATSYETVWRERAQLTDRVEQLETELARHRDLEQLLRATLVSAEQAAQRLKEDGRAEVTAMLEEARLEAREITRRARAERDALVLDARRIRLMLNAALDAVDEADVAGAEATLAETTAEAEAA